jgi:hypothetical protein
MPARHESLVQPDAITAWVISALNQKSANLAR